MPAFKIAVTLAVEDDDDSDKIMASASAFVGALSSRYAVNRRSARCRRVSAGRWQLTVALRSSEDRLALDSPVIAHALKTMDFPIKDVSLARS